MVVRWHTRRSGRGLLQEGDDLLDHLGHIPPRPVARFGQLNQLAIWQRLGEEATEACRDVSILQSPDHQGRRRDRSEIGTGRLQLILWSRAVEAQDRIEGALVEVVPDQVNEVVAVAAPVAARLAER